MSLCNINKRVVTQITLGGIFLMLGCAIYLLFRTKTLNIYQWCATLGIAEHIDDMRLYVKDWEVPSFIKYSLPDGLYCASYILIVDAIWHNERRMIKYSLISLVPIVTIGSEICQSWGLVKGTFDINDLICYSVPPILYAITELTNKKVYL